MNNKINYWDFYWEGYYAYLGGRTREQTPDPKESTQEQIQAWESGFSEAEEDEGIIY
jgi:ribosome modulation factor